MLDFFANPARFEALSRTLSPWLLASWAILFVIALPIALVFSPADYQQGDTVRLMYIHVPAAWMATIAYTFIAVMSVMAFIWRHPIADALARAAAPVGLAMTGLALVSGAFWGKPTWGAWWVWDARLTSVLVLFFIYLAYLAIWDTISDPARAAKFARVTALLGFVNIPIIKFSVDWWNSLHQPASLVRAGGPTIDGSMLTPLLMMIAGYTLFFAWAVCAGAEAQIIEARARRRSARAPRRILEVDGTARTEQAEGEDG